MSPVVKQVAVVLLLSLICVAQSHAGEDGIIGFEAIDYFPAYSPIRNQRKGYVLDLVQAMKKDGALQGEVQFLPIARLQNEFEYGAVSVKFPDSPAWNLEDSKERFYSLPIVDYKDGLVMLEEVTYDHLSEVRSIVTLNGFTLEIFSPAQLEQLRVERTTSIDSMFKMLDANRVEAIYMNYLVAQNVAPTHMRHRLVFAEALGIVTSHFHFSSYDQAVIEKINAFLQSNEFLLQSLVTSYK